ncbi:MAG TPA: alkaline phosphatase family protein [Kofleriaceae bacterium]|nr:alkaline phosphatase family protein [Kofleriaceae bacterium]
MIGTWGAIQAGLSGSEFMDDLDRPLTALAAAPPLVEPPPTPPLAERVVIVIIDGLRYDVSRDLPFLNELRARGIDGRAHAQYPTFSRPGYVNILTGVPPAFSGVRTNRFRGAVRVDSLMDRLRDAPPRGARLRAGFASDYDPMPRLFLRPRTMPIEPEEDVDLTLMDEPTADAWRRAIRNDLRGDFDDPRYAPWPGGFREAARGVLAAHDTLAVLLIGVVDAAGHEYGGLEPEYRAAAFEADAALRAAVSGLDLSRDAIIVVADHGHTDRGGHGGLEPTVVEVPFIMAGAGVVPGGKPDIQLMDVAPTAAILLGIPAPGHGLGKAALSALRLTPEAAARIAAIDDARVRTNRAVVERELSSERTARLGKRALRAAIIAALTSAAIFLAWALRLRGGMRLDIRVIGVGAPAFFIVYYTLIGVLGERFSPSLLPARGHIAWELLKYGAIGSIVHILVSWLALRRRMQLPERLAAANGIAWLGLMFAMVPAGLFWAFFPAPYVEVPGPRLLVFIPAVKVAIACYTVAVALSLLLEVIVFFSRAIDPRVRVIRLERAIEKARAQAERSDTDP